MNDNLEKIQKQLDDALKENKRLEVELERVKLELKLERSESAKERAKLMLETRKIQRETGMRKGKRIKTHSRARKVRHVPKSFSITNWEKGIFKTNIKPESVREIPKKTLPRLNLSVIRDKENPNMIRALTKSTGRLKEIVEMRIKQEMTLAEIGAHFSISRQRVRQILEKVRNEDYK